MCWAKLLTRAHLSQSWKKIDLIDLISQNHDMIARDAVVKGSENFDHLRAKFTIKSTNKASGDHK